MTPWPHHQKHFVVACVLRLDRLVNRRRSINVFLVPQAVHQHDRNFQRLRIEDFVHRLLLPKRIVARMLQQFPPEAHLLQAVPPPQLPRRARRHEFIVIVEMARPPSGLVFPRAFLLGDVKTALFRGTPLWEPVSPPPPLHPRPALSASDTPTEESRASAA